LSKHHTDVDQKDEEEHHVDQALKAVWLKVLLGDCCVDDVGNVLESKEEADKAHPGDLHHFVEEYLKHRLRLIVVILDLLVVC